MFLAPCKLAQTPSLQFLNPFFHSLPMAAPSESSLISKLQSSDSSGIHALVSDYLSPSISQSDKEIQTRPNPNSLPRQALSLLPQLFSIHPPQTPPGAFQVQRRRFATRTAPRLQALPRLLGHRRFSVGFQAILRRIPETSLHALSRVLRTLRRSRRRGFGSS